MCQRPLGYIMHPERLETGAQNVPAKKSRTYKPRKSRNEPDYESHTHTANGGGSCFC